MIVVASAAVLFFPVSVLYVLLVVLYDLSKLWISKYFSFRVLFCCSPLSFWHTHVPIHFHSSRCEYTKYVLVAYFRAFWMKPLKPAQIFPNEPILWPVYVWVCVCVFPAWCRYDAFATQTPAHRIDDVGEWNVTPYWHTSNASLCSTLFSWLKFGWKIFFNSFISNAMKIMGLN